MLVPPFLSPRAAASHNGAYVVSRAAIGNKAYAMTRKGEAETALGAGLVFSAAGGLFGAVVLVTAAPWLAEVAIRFSSFEYFWLVLLGLTCAVFVSLGDPLKGVVSLLLGLLVSAIGLIPMMIGMFTISEILRYAVAMDSPARVSPRNIGNVLHGMWALARRYPGQALRGSAVGTAIGALPGASADIAAWISYALSKRFSSELEKFGTGHVEGIIESGAAQRPHAQHPALLHRGRRRHQQLALRRRRAARVRRAGVLHGGERLSI